MFSSKLKTWVGVRKSSVVEMWVALVVSDKVSAGASFAMVSVEMSLAGVSAGVLFIGASALVEVGFEMSFKVFEAGRRTAFLAVDLEVDLRWAVLRVVLVVGFLVDFGVEPEEGAFLERLVVRPSIDLFESIVYNYNMKATKITKKQQAVLDFLEDFTEEKGYSPSYREIMTGLGLSSVSAVAEHIDNMVAKGILRKVPGAARSLEVLDFRHLDTVELFRVRLMEATEEEREVLVKAAEILGLDLED